MVRPGLRRSEIDWENVDIHISREEMEREQEHEAAIQQAKQYLIKNFPKFCTINNGYYETETFNHDAGMYEVMHVDHIVIGDQAIYVIKTVKFPEHVELYGSSDAKTGIMQRTQINRKRISTKWTMRIRETRVIVSIYRCWQEKLSDGMCRRLQLSILLDLQMSRSI